MLRASPFLHVDADRIYNPLTDRAVVAGDAEYDRLRGLLGMDGVRSSLRGTGVPVDETVLRSEDLTPLIAAGWLVRGDVSHRHRLKIVSLETTTACNQKCYFCPVSIAPREDQVMSEAMFESIVGQLIAFGGTLESVFLQSYNEPTIDRNFVQWCRTLFAAKLPVAVLSNGSGLTPAKVDALADAGPLRFLCINLSTLDRERYAHDRGEDHLGIVLRNLDYAKSVALAEQMKIVVLGVGDSVHERDFEAIRERFAGSHF